MDKNSNGQIPGPVNFDFDLPPLSNTVVQTAKLKKSGNNDDPIPALKKIVAADPVVAARTLRRINSAYYGLQRRVGNVEQAIVLLGFEEVHRLIVTAGLTTMEQLFEAAHQHNIFRYIIRRSVATALIADIISQELYLSSAHLTYTSGLLHSIGRITLLYNDPTVYEKFWGYESSFKEPETANEEAIYGVNYSDLSAHVISMWDLPETLALAIKHHINPPDPPEDRTIGELTLVINAARTAANEMLSTDTTVNMTLSPNNQQSLNQLAFKDNQPVNDLKRRITKHEDKIKRFVDLVSPDKKD